MYDVEMIPYHLNDKIALGLVQRPGRAGRSAFDYSTESSLIVQPSRPWLFNRAAPNRLIESSRADASVACLRVVDMLTRFRN